MSRSSNLQPRDDEADRNEHRYRHGDILSRRCEREAKRGTGTGMCEQILDASGKCPRASDHIES